MNNQSNFLRSKGGVSGLLVGVSAIGLIGAAPAIGQVTPADSSTAANDIVITGIRQANANAIKTKRNSDTIVDAISSEDIGALPDKSITETLQRIPGVSVNRFAAANDPDHVSEEGQTPVIRGLPYVHSEFNGRDAFTANRGRALNFQDIPPELAASVEVYKNQTADRIEGGIAGVINIVTRRPLDTNKNIYSFNADVNYGDLRKKATPEGSALISHQWDTGNGRFGVLLSGSYSKIQERVENARVTTYRDYRSADAGRGIVASDRGGLTGGAAGTDYYVPIGGGYSRQDNDRERIGASGALEYESADGSLQATLQAIHSETKQTYTERTLGPVEDTSNIVLVNGVGGSVFDANNVLLKGRLGSADGAGIGIETQELSRGEVGRATTDDFSGHITWKATERFKLDLDGQYATSTSRFLDTSVVAIASTIQDFDNTGSTPITTYLRPANFRGPQYNSAPLSTYTSSTSALADPATTFWRSAQDHQDNTRGTEFAFRADGDFRFSDDDSAFFRKVRFGARYAERKQTIRSDGYNWGNLSERWNAGITTAAQLTPAGFGVIPLGNFLRGASGDTSIIGFLGNPAAGYDQLQAGVAAIRAVRGSFGYSPLTSGSRNGSGTDPASCASNPPVGGAACTIANGAGDGFHNIGEVSTNKERTIAAYARVDFGAKDIEALGGVTIDGNIGLRFVETRSVSSGYYSVPSVASAFPNLPTPCTPGYTPPSSGGQPGYNICANSAGDRAAILTFLGAAGNYVPNTTAQTYRNWLPSFNLRIAPNDKLQYRFAYSRGISRPSFNDLRNYTQFSVASPPGLIPANTPFPAVALKATSYGNPLLRPTTSDNFDLTQEWYYSPQGSLTIGVFYKRLKNVYSVLNGIATSNGPNGTSVTNNIGVDPANPAILTYTNNGVTLLASNAVTANNDRTYGLRGLEVDWRQGSLSFLPSPFDGLGFSANFTYIDADQLTYQPVLPANFDTSVGSGYNPNTGYLTAFPFPGISKYNANAELFYEKYGISTRIAYTWRSSYFVSSQDSLGPNDPTFTDASGFWDAQAFYNFTPQIKVGVTGSNLFNTKIRTYNQINKAGLTALRGVNEADRRFTFGVRVGF